MTAVNGKRARGDPTANFPAKNLAASEAAYPPRFAAMDTASDALSDSTSVPAPKYVTMTRSGTWSTWSRGVSLRWVSQKSQRFKYLTLN